MARELDCGKIMHGCTTKIRGETDEEVMRRAAEHARKDHGMQEIDSNTAGVIKSHIRTV